MRKAMRRISAGFLGAGMIVAVTAGVTAGAAAAATTSPAVQSAQNAAVSWPIVSRGAAGERVVTIQYLLGQRGYRLAVDGLFGPATQAAVMSFQRRNKVVVSGVVGNITWPKLVVTLKLHSKGDAVRALQHQLRYAYGHRSVAVDGYFGQKTLAAVKIFQRNHKLTADGIVGNATWKALVRGNR
jgi:zinc D-Ala-D-Ala carboxypeptidase